jgi:hypothetical protein
MTSATLKLIEAVERLNMTGEIGDGMVANLHELAGLARLEVTSRPIPPLGDLVTLSPETLEKLRNYPLQPIMPADIQNVPKLPADVSDAFRRVREMVRTERELTRARNAHDASTFTGRLRIDEAREAYRAACDA